MNEPPENLPTHLADQVYLLGYDVARQRLRGSNRGLAVRAAVLVELWDDGRLTAEGKRAVATPSGRHPEGAVETDVLRRIAQSTPRRWGHWVSKDTRTTERAVRDRLAAQRRIVVEEWRTFGFVPRRRVRVPDTRVVSELVRRCRAVSLGDTPVESIAPREAALVAIAAAVRWNGVLGARERWRHRARLKALTERGGPAAAALRAAVASQDAAASSVA